jgi:uncharacterized membrane protein
MIDTTLLHPMIVHFPIALLIVGFLFDIGGMFIKHESFTSTGFYLLILGSAGVIAAFLSGNMAGGSIAEEGMLGKALEKHEEAAELTIWLVSTTAVLRISLLLIKRYSGYLKAGVLVLYFISIFAIGRTGYYGGKLVYENAAGVQLNLGNEFGDQFGKEDED